jgi:ABC-type sugar transport system permease subunit
MFTPHLISKLELQHDIKKTAAGSEFIGQNELKQVNSSPKTALPILLIVNLWLKLPFSTIFYGFT